MFVVFEGVDGSGKTTQIGNIGNAIREWNKYQSIVFEREPTYKAGEIIQRLVSETDPLSNAEVMAIGFIEDRRAHYHGPITGDMQNGRVVLCDRFSMSTLAYQSVQGQKMDDLVKAHFQNKIGSPDITFYLGLTPEEATSRINKRISEMGGKREKFEEPDFIEELVKKHEFLYEESQKDGDIKRLLGRVVKINAKQTIECVTRDIVEILNPFYQEKQKVA